MTFSRWVTIQSLTITLQNIWTGGKWMNLLRKPIETLNFLNLNMWNVPLVSKMERFTPHVTV